MGIKLKFLDKIIPGLVLAMVVLVVANVASTAAMINRASGAEVRISMWRPIDRLDPVYATRIEDVQLFDALFQGLVDMENGKPVSGDASSWTISDDGRVYTFILRDDITWSDGKPVTAYDYQLAFRRLLDTSNDQAARPSYLLLNIKNAENVEKGKVRPEALGVTAIDNRTLKIELSRPASYFLDILTYPGLVPVPGHLVEKYGNDWWKVEPTVSNGAYTLAKSWRNNHLVLHKRRHKKFPQAPDTVHMIHLKNFDAAMQRVISNRLDIIYDIRSNEIDWVRDRIGFSLTTVSQPKTVYAIFNTKSKKLADRRVRRALFLVVDRETIAKALNASPAVSFVPTALLQGVEGNLLNELKSEDRDSRIKRARALLAEAGYDEDNPLEVKIMKVPRLLLGNTALVLRSMFAQIGVKATIDRVDERERSIALRTGDYDVAIGNWVADYNDGMTFYGILEAGASKNHSAFSNPEYDRFLRKALEELDGHKRRRVYAKLENILREEAPIVPIAHPEVTVVSAPTVASVGVDRNFYLSISDIRLNGSQ